MIKVQTKHHTWPNEVRFYMFVHSIQLPAGSWHDGHDLLLRNSKNASH